MGILRNTRHERFCQLVASGGEKSDSFRAVFPHSRNWKRQVVNVKACVLAKRCLSRIRNLQQISANETIASRTELARFLTRIIRTPIADLDASSPLAQEHDSKGGKLKMPDKLSAVSMLAKLMGYNEAEKSESRYAFEPDRAVLEKLGLSPMTRLGDADGAAHVA